MRVPVTESAFFVTFASSKSGFSEIGFYEPTMFLALKRLTEYVADDRDSRITFTVDFAEPPVDRHMEERKTRRIEGRFEPQAPGHLLRRVSLCCFKHRPTVEKFFKTLSTDRVLFGTQSFLNPNG